MSYPRNDLVGPLPAVDFRRFSLYCGMATAFTGALMLVAWQQKWMLVTRLHPGWPSMKPNTALAFTLAGVSLWLYHASQSGSRTKALFSRSLSLIAAIVVAGIGLATFTEYVSGINLGLDDLLFHASLSATGLSNPGRMSAATAGGLVLLASALLLSHTASNNRLVSAQLLALVGGLVGLAGVLAYLYGVPLLGVSAFSTMSVHTALLLLAMGLGVCFARPKAGIAQHVAGDALGGAIARRSLLFIVVLPVAIDGLWLYASRLGLYGPEFTTALTAISGVVLLCFLVWESARRISLVDRQRQRTEDRDSWLAAIISCCDDAIIGRDVDGTIVSWNRGAERLFGYTEEEILGRPASSILAPDQQQELRELIDAARQGRSVDRYETVRTRKDGTSVAVSLALSPVTDRSGGVIGSALLVQDITRQKRDEIRLGESRIQLDAIVHSAMDAVLMVNDRQEIVLFNTAAERMFGYSAQEIIGQPLLRLIPESYRSAHVEHIRRFGQAGITSRAMGALSTVQGLRANGEVFPIEASISHFDSAGGRLYAAIVRDESERQKTEAALRLAQAQLLSALEAGGMGTWSWDVPADCVTLSDPLLKLFGMTTDDIGDRRLRTMLLLIYAADRPAVERALEAAVQHGATVDVECRIRRPDGGLQWVVARGRLERDPQGQPWRLTGVCVDVSGRKRLEDTLLQSHKMEALGTLAGGVAHDFNNILMAIRGNIELALDELPQNHAVRQNLERVETAGNRAAHLVRQILTFSRQQAPARGVISLQQEVEEVVKLLRSTLPARIEIRAEFLPGVPAIFADPTQIHQILMNLGTNAAHAIGETSGWVEVRLEAVEIFADRPASATGLAPGRYARLTFRDNGCGMDQPTLGRVFEPFFTTKGVGKGTGLGLSVVHGIMKNHGGTVTAHSEAGKGATFQLYFPATQAEVSAAKNSVEPEIPKGKGERILHVDDEHALVLVIRRRLEQLGYVVTGYADPREALEAFRSSPDAFDAVITDVAMPHLPGAELVEAIRQIRPDIPVIMASGYLRPEDHAAAARLGVSELLSKPFDLAEVGRALQRVFVKDLAAQKV